MKYHFDHEGFVCDENGDYIEPDEHLALLNRDAPPLSPGALALLGRGPFKHEIDAWSNRVVDSKRHGITIEIEDNAALLEILNYARAAAGVGK